MQIHSNQKGGEGCHENDDDLKRSYSLKLKHLVVDGPRSR